MHNKVQQRVGTDIKICFSLFELQDSRADHSEEVITIKLGAAWCYTLSLPPGLGLVLLMMRGFIKVHQNIFLLIIVFEITPELRRGDTEFRSTRFCCSLWKESTPYVVWIFEP